MAFARSASGPAGLSINTGAANQFGSTPNQPPAAGGLFGSASATQPSTQASSLFGNQTTSQPNQTSSLFGGPANTNTNQQQQQQHQQQQQPGGGGGLFGSSMASTSKPGSLFGGLTANTGTGGGGLFGGTTAATTNGSTPFGSSTANTQATGGSLFGQAAPQQPAMSTAGGGLFAQPAKPAASLFGGAANNAQAPAATGTTGGLFGQRPAAPAGGLFGGSNAAAPGRSLFTSVNQQANSQQQNQAAAPALGSTMGPQAMIPGVRIDLSNLRNTTRFNDLQEDLQKEIAAIDTHIQNCMAQKDQVDAFIPQHEAQLEEIPGDVRFVSRKYAAVDSALGADLHAIKTMRDQVKADAEEAKLSFNAVNNLLLPSQYHVSPGFFGSSTRQTQQQEGGSNGSTDGGQSTSEDLVSYFSRATDEMDEQIKRLQKTVREIDTHLGGVQQNIMEHASRLQASNGSLGGNGQDERVMELYQVLRDFEEGIVQVATVVGGAREGVTELQMNDFRGRGLIGSS